MNKLAFVLCFLNIVLISTSNAQNHCCSTSSEITKLSCNFKLYSNFEILNHFSKIKPTQIHGILNNEIELNSLSLSNLPDVKEHDQFLLEFKVNEENLKIIMHPKMFPEEHHTLIKIEFNELVKTIENQKTIPAKLFYPVQMPISKKKNIHVYGIEIGPCKAI